MFRVPDPADPGLLDPGGPMLFRHTPSLTPREAAEGLSRGNPQLVDVRQSPEVAQARVEGARSTHLNELAHRLGELDADRPVAFLCASA
ncbi:MAG TPA: rhodanese-like domain-containing protein [Solirubrobacteraceae bacterium]|nr:rhodanese-like domain-containing protein [Solirubrobacteraceae bacterium]